MDRPPLARRVIVEQPENSETPLESLRSWLTPSRLFFVRNHFDVPEVQLDTWRLRVGGLVDREFELDWSHIRDLPTRSVFATMECAGNGRSYLDQSTHGVQWGAGAVGHAEWTGPPLSTVLEAAGLRPETREIVFSGADRGREADHPQTMAYARSLPLDKALDPDTLLATEMNGEPLTAAHGFPLRLIVPGWYGVASVKWLTRIQATDKAFAGYYQTRKYTVARRTARGLSSEVVGEMQPKSEILRPQPGESCGVGLNRIVGVAWAGPDAVEAVEVSVDGGRSWEQAELEGMRAPYSWILWEYSWRPTQPGASCLLSRAVSTAGRIQPLRHDPLNGGYLIHHSRPVQVQVEARWDAEGVDDGERLVRTAFDAALRERAEMKLDVEMNYSEGAGI